MPQETSLVLLGWTTTHQLGLIPPWKQIPGYPRLEEDCKNLRPLPCVSWISMLANTEVLRPSLGPFCLPFACCSGTQDRFTWRRLYRCIRKSGDANMNTVISARNQFWVERWVEAYVEYIFFLAKNPRLCLQSTRSLFDEQNALLNTCCQLFLCLFSRSVQQVSKQKPKWNPLFYFDVIRTHLQILTMLHFHTFCARPTGQGEKPNLFGPSTTEAHFHCWENLGVQSH